MSKLRDAAQAVVDAIQTSESVYWVSAGANVIKVVSALREALQEPETSKECDACDRMRVMLHRLVGHKHSNSDRFSEWSQLILDAEKELRR